MKVCPENEHDWGEPRVMRATSGPMEGDWIVHDCRRCNTFSIQPLDGSDGFDNIVATLSAMGLDPQRGSERHA